MHDMRLRHFSGNKASPRRPKLIPRTFFVWSSHSLFATLQNPGLFYTSVPMQVLDRPTSIDLAPAETTPTYPAFEVHAYD